MVCPLGGHIVTVVKPMGKEKLFVKKPFLG